MRLRTSTLIIASVFALPVLSTGQNKAQKKTAKQLQADISYLASDELAGRRTGTEGEKKAADYIEARYKDLEIPPYKGQYRYPFKFVYGKEIAAATHIMIGDKAMRMNDDVFPMPFSANGHVTGDVLPDVTEQGNIWVVSLYSDKDQANEPHFEAEKHMYEYTKEAKKAGATAVVYVDMYGGKYEPEFNKYSEFDPSDIPVVFVKYSTYQNVLKPLEADQRPIHFDLNISIGKTERIGTDVAAYIDNGAKYTVIVGAHYDHLGYGEDGNSLYANAKKEHKIHHGADDNASGTAALMEVAKWVQKKGLSNYNYLFIHFSGEELGLYGSKAFVKDQKIDSAHTAYMINMDMVGRLNDSTRALTLGGVGTSPAWEDVVTMGNGAFKLVIDSSGIGPSDHTSFYNAGIPVLFFFTGTHKDYHKPSDIASSINYKGEVEVIDYVESVLKKMDETHTKPGYLVTKQPVMGKSSFKVTMGIMPDYSFQDGGVRVDGVSDGRPASKAGVKAGDIIVQIGNIKVQGMQTYMDALHEFSPGDKTTVQVIRDGKTITLPLEWNK